MNVVLAIVLFVVGAYFDFVYSSAVQSVGGIEWNPLMRDKAKHFSKQRYLIFNAAFLAVVVVGHYALIPEGHKWETAPGLIFVGLAHLAAGLLVNRPLYKKLLKNRGA